MLECFDDSDGTYIAHLIGLSLTMTTNDIFGFFKVRRVRLLLLTHSDRYRRYLYSPPDRAPSTMLDVFGFFIARRVRLAGRGCFE